MCKGNDKLKIAFRLDAGNKIGMGHAVRCSALADKLVIAGCDCTYFCRDNVEIRMFVTSQGFGFIPVPDIGLYDELRWMKKALIHYDAVIIDLYSVSDQYIEALNRPGLIVVCCDDNAIYEYSCDAVINGNLHAMELAFRIGKKKPKLLLGGQYTLLRKEFCKAKPIDIREKANKIFVCFGGSDLNNLTPTVVKALQTLPAVEITAVIGAMNICNIEAGITAGENTQIIKNPPSVAAIMQTCDIAVTACGSMVYELASLGIPSIVIVQADNQKLIAEYLNKNALMKSFGNAENIHLKSLCDEVKILSGDQKRRKCESEALKNAVSRHGAENVVFELLKLMG